MHRLTSYFLLLLWFAFVLSCNPLTPPPPLQTSLFVYRFNPPAFVEFSQDFQVIREIPFAIPPNCGLFNVFPAPVGKFMAMELSCPSGQTVLFLDTSAPQGPEAAVAQPVTDVDSHFLAWTFDGKAAYLKIDSLGTPQVVRVSTNGARDFIPITEFTYDLATSPNKGEFTFTFSRGLGQGSELWLAKRDGKVVEQMYADQFHYISFAHYSPDAGQIAFIKIADSQTPFTVGELWIINNDGSNPRKLADADAGHGYAANWSPDGKRIAFVVRENPDDERADQSSDLLISNIYIVEIESQALTKVTNLEAGRVETPVWSPEGNTFAFDGVINDRMTVHIADLSTGEIRTLITESTCCPVWMQK